MLTLPSSFKTQTATQPFEPYRTFPQPGSLLLSPVISQTRKVFDIHRVFDRGDPHKHYIAFMDVVPEDSVVGDIQIDHDQIRLYTKVNPTAVVSCNDSVLHRCNALVLCFDKIVRSTDIINLTMILTDDMLVEDTFRIYLKTLRVIQQKCPKLNITLVRSRQ